MKRARTGTRGGAVGSLLLVICLRFASCGPAVGGEAIAEPLRRGSELLHGPGRDPLQRPVGWRPPPTDDRDAAPEIVGAPELDPAVEFPDDPLWRATWLQIDNPQRAHLPETALIDGWVDARPGRHIADVGAGGGFYTFRFAARVAPGGAVFAIDVDPLAARKIAWEAHRRSVRNVTAARVPRRRLGLGAQRFDTVLMVSTGIFGTCDLPARASYMEQIATAVRVGGHFVFLDATDSVGVPPPLPRCPIPSGDEMVRLASPYFALDARVDTPHSAGPSNTALRLRRVAAPAPL